MIIFQRFFVAMLIIFTFLRPVFAEDEASVPKVITNSIDMKLVLISAGEFVMGSSHSKEKLATEFPGMKPEDFEDEYPAHRVRISKPFYLGKNEVTQEEWLRVMGTKPWKGKFGIKEGSNYPAIHVNWDDATEFCRKLSDKEGKHYRLPTEAEWEYACRAGTDTEFSFSEGSLKHSEYGWWSDKPIETQIIAATTVSPDLSNTTPVQPTPNLKSDESDNDVSDTAEELLHEVGKKKPNPWGLHDMHGNVWEWCSDGYGADYYRKSADTDPKGPTNRAHHIMRGGAYYLNPAFCRSRVRSGIVTRARTEGIGFRVVLEIDQKGR